MTSTATRRILIDVVIVIGFVVTVIAEIMSAADTGQRLEWSEVGRILGIAVFLGSVGVTLHQVLLAVEKLEDSQERTTRTLRVAEINRLLGEVGQWCDEQPGAVHVQAALDVAMRLHMDFVPQLAGGLERFCAAAPQSRAIEVGDQSPVHDLLANLAERLPEGGVWLGVTKLEQVRTWSETDEAFHRFALTMRKRGGSGQVLVGRIYHFTSRAAEQAMVPSLKLEARSRVTVRCLVGGSHERVDMSILFAPPEDEDRRITALDGDLVSRLEEAGYRMICAARFSTRDDGVLRAATLFDAANPESRVLLGAFGKRWVDSRPCPA